MSVYTEGIFRLANFLVFRLNRDLKIEECSDKFLTDRRLSRNEIIGQDISVLLNSREYVKIIRSSLITGKPVELNYVSLPGLIEDHCDISIVSDNSGIYLFIKESALSALGDDDDLKKYRELADSVFEGVVLYNLEDKKIEEVNKPVAEIFGYSRSELCGMHSDKLFQGDNYSLNEVFNPEAEIEIELSLIFLKKKDGTLFPAEMRSRYFDIGDTKYLCLVINDISERYENEKRFFENEEYFYSLVSYSPDFICIKDDKGRWKLTNEVNLKLFDLEGIDYEGKTDSELGELSPFYRDAFNHCIVTDEAAWKNGKLNRCDEVIMKPDGRKKVYDVIKIPLFNEDGSRKSLIVMGRNITLRKQAEEKISEIADQYKSLYENAAIGIYRTTADGRVILANQSFLDILAYDSFDDIKNVNASEFYSINNSRRRFIEMALVSNTIKGYETVLRRKDGRDIVVRLNASIIKNNNNEIEYIEGLVEDISEKRKFEEILVKAKEEAEKSDQLKSEFLAQMSHEIRTPINSLLNSVGLIKEEFHKKINSDLQGCFSIIDRSSHRIIRTIDSILNMSEIQTGTYEYSAGEVDLLKDIINPIYQEFGYIAQTKGVSINLEANCNNTVVHADEYGLRQIFSNLIDNAVKFTNSGGDVKIKLYRNKKNDLNIEVIDTGIGISRDYLPFLFKPFTQEEQGYTRKFEGNGLGLALVAKFCEFNNASITVESEKGAGSLFRVNMNQ